MTTVGCDNNTQQWTAWRGCRKWLWALGIAGLLLALAIRPASAGEPADQPACVDGLQVSVTDAETGKTYAAHLPARCEAETMPAGYKEYKTDFPDAEMTLHVLLAARHDAVECEVTALSGREAMRDVSIEISVPGADAGKMVWMPSDAYPRTTGATAYTLNYRGDFVLPILSAYTPGQGKATSLVMPFDGLYPHLQMGCKEGRLFARTTNLRLQAQHSAHTAVWCVQHAPDWRPALAWALKQYPEYFMVRNPDFPAGPMVLGARMPDAQLDYLHQLGIRWSESDALQTDSYGLYMAHATDPKVVAQAQDYIERAKKHGISVFLYWQSLEMKPQLAEAWFPQSRFARADDSTPAEGWKNQYIWMIPDRSSSWHRHILDQLFGMIDLLPGAAGAFCDNNLHSGFSYGQDDGVSAGRGERILWGGLDSTGSAPTPTSVRPLYQYAFAEAQTLEDIRARLSVTHKGMWANLVADAATLRDVDGIMVESMRFMNEKYAGLLRPMVCITYYDSKDPQRLDKLSANLRQILVAGMQPGFNEWEVRSLDGPMLRHYMALFKETDGRSWVLDPDPVAATWSLKQTLQSEIFQRADGSYAVVLASDPGAKGDVQVRVHVATPPHKRIAFLRRLMDDKWTPLAISEHNGEWMFTVPAHTDASEVIFGAQAKG